MVDLLQLSLSGHHPQLGVPSGEGALNHTSVSEVLALAEIATDTTQGIVTEVVVLESIMEYAVV
jgi:hypothetical protein